CPTYFGRKAISSGEPIKVLEWIKDFSVTEKEAQKLTDEQLSSLFVLGDFVNREEPIFEGSSVNYQQEGE
ncbi:MAG: hypothetical protein JRK26_27390, partial [Deltaproteobacteria bacterium]|nr:hypothetical protein [Deltaproteobacteria bacterium]